MERKFDIRKELSLEFLGEAWQECRLVLRLVGSAELKALASKEAELKKAVEEDTKRAPELLDYMISLVEKYFVEGTGVFEGEVEKLLKSDLKNLPPEVIAKAHSIIIGTVDPNLPTPSNVS